MLRIAVCDDSPQFLENAAELIRKWVDQSTAPINLHTFDNGKALIEANTSSRFDIVFLDIIMPAMSGMETARKLRKNDNSVRIVFLTSSPEFALESYSVKAQGYLWKPIDYEKIKETLDDCASFFTKEPGSIVIKSPIGYRKLYLHSIEYIEAQNKKVISHLGDQGSIQSAEPLYRFENLLTFENGFFKCHRSYLVNLNNVDRFDSTLITTKSGCGVPIARGFAKPFKEAYFALMFGKQGGTVCC